MTYGVYTAGTAGDEVSSTYEGRHLTFTESQITHPSHTDGFVDKGDPVVVGDVVGVAFTSAAAATDLVAIDTEGIWQLSVIATNLDGNSAVAVGDTIYINTTTALLSKDYNKNTQRKFGVALYPIATGVTDVIAVKVHAGCEDSMEQVGTSAVYYTNDTAGVIFREYRYDCGATSGDARAIYNRLYLTGAGGGGESLRSYTDIVGVACATAHGAHISIGFGESTTGGSVTGQGVAVRATLGLPNVAMGAGGTYAAISPEIYSFGSASDAGAVTELSFIRCVNGGNASGIADVDDDAFLLVLDGGAIAGGNIVEASTTETNYAYSARCKLAGTTMYMMFASAVG